jgi:hypothetical protein
LFRTEATRPVGPPDISPSTAGPVAQAAVPSPPLPGTVQNVRWADAP